MKAHIQILIGLVAAMLLAACGGGGGGSPGGGSFTPADLRVTFDPVATTATPSSVISVAVRVANNNGTSVADGTSVSLSVTPSDLALVSSFIAPPLLGATTTTTTRGGIAQFRLHTRAVGTVTLRATATSSGGSATATLNVNIVAGPGTDQRLTIQTQNTSLPFNPSNASQPTDSPFVSRTEITFRRLDGTLISMPNGVSVAVQGGTGTCAFSTLDDPATLEINEILVQLGSGPVNVTAGIATIFVRSRSQPGVCTIVVTGQDPQTGETVSASITFNIVGGVGPGPTAVFISAPTDPLYVQGSGGVGTIPLTASVIDGNNRPVANPPAGINNVRVEIVSGPGGGERLTALNAAGVTVSGTVINIRSTGGVVAFNLISGTRTGPVLIRVTADRLDNNVDNGIQDPVTATRSVTISDGRLFDLDITNQNALVVDNIGTTPGDPVYRLNISVIATDREGNPVIPGTEIEFGLIDSPLTAFNTFAIAGNDGNPQEGGPVFTAPGGNFTPVGPGDTLVVFGEEIPGQRDMEAARFVQQVTSFNSLLVTRNFNRNDTTGTIVDGGPIFPYVIGRAADGNIGARALTNVNGIATVELRYSRSKLGKPFIVWAQGQGVAANGSTNLVADVERLTFAAAGPATLTAAPSGVAANTTNEVRLCLRDVNNQGVPGAAIQFTFAPVSTGTVTVDGQGSGGFVTPPTGADGCTFATVSSVNLLTDGTTITFVSNDATATVTIAAVGSNIQLTASPPAFQVPRSTIVQTTLTLQVPGGQPIANIQLSVACSSGGGSLTPGPIAPTDANGQTTVQIAVAGFVSDPDGAGPLPTTNASGNCTFSTPGNNASTVVTFNGNGNCNEPGTACQGTPQATPEFEAQPPPPGPIVLTGQVGGPAPTRSILVSNVAAGTGAQTLNVSTSGLSGRLSVTPQVAAIAAGANQNFTITCNNATATPLPGPFVQTLTFATNDPDEGEGTVTYDVQCTIN